jgi:antirestriction protein
MTHTDNIPRIYVADLAAYNSGTLHGCWVACNQHAEDVAAEIEAMLAASPEAHSEEFAIHDFENFGDYKVGEYENIEQVVELADLITEHGTFVTGIVDHVGGLDHLDEARRIIEEDYQGMYDSLADWAEEFLGESGQLEALPEALRGYFDYDAYARDAELGGDVFTIDGDDGKVHVLWSR